METRKGRQIRSPVQLGQSVEKIPRKAMEDPLEEYNQKQQPQQNIIKIEKNLIRKQDSILYLLIKQFSQNNNKPQILVPWMEEEFKQLEERIIGQNYVIIGPSQSGKYSAVRYALGTYHESVKQIIINCEIDATQTQFLKRLIYQTKKKCGKGEWPSTQKDMNRILVNQNIDFNKLTQFIVKNKEKIVIILKNGQHLVQYKKQMLLYNLFQWMKYPQVKQRVGLIILTSKLMMIDKFQVRVKSRFCGRSLKIFRPKTANVYIDIIAKRIERILIDKMRIYKPIPNGLEQQIYQSQINQDSDDQQDKEESVKKGKAKLKKNKKIKPVKPPAKTPSKRLNNKKIQASNPEQKSDSDESQEIIKKIKTNNINNYLNETDIKGLKLQDYYPCDNSFQISSISYQEQLQCLNKLMISIEKNKQLYRFFKNRLEQYQIMTIPFILRIFQHILISLQERMIRDLPQQSLNKLIFLLIQKNVNFEFPQNALQSNFLEILTNVEILLLILIYKMLQEKQYPIKLKNIYQKFRQTIHQQITNQNSGTAHSYTQRMVERALMKLYNSQIIKFKSYQFEIWNTEIILMYQKSKVKKGFEYLKNNNTLPQIFLKLLKSVNV